MASQTELKALTMLRSIQLTHDMETRHLRKLASMAQEVQFEKDELIYRRGDRGRAVYLIQEGEVVIEMIAAGHGRIVLNTLQAGQFFGWSSLFPFERKMAWTRATKPTQALAFDAGQLLQACRTDHGFEYALTRRAGRDLTERITAARRQLSGSEVV
ncbi:MAG TPA: cyclic nucleotide-binding domain-containing protein [Anaerolineae bacterium]|nr:cyclic nucleotide-binding domain-containing protein [Anaerolineae bacterium]HMR63520.1 cyclic nucleotide-binding domain-containing protein [Anaerolineae bacterium]